MGTVPDGEQEAVIGSIVISRFWQLTTELLHRRPRLTKAMGRIEDETLPPYSHIPTPWTAKRNRRICIFAWLVAMLVITVNLCGVLRVSSWKPCAGHGVARLSMAPRSHYVLPSGDEIPAIALGKSARYRVRLFLAYLGCRRLEGWKR